MSNCSGFKLSRACLKITLSSERFEQICMITWDSNACFDIRPNSPYLYEKYFTTAARRYVTITTASVSMNYRCFHDVSVWHVAMWTFWSVNRTSQAFYTMSDAAGRPISFSLVLWENPPPSRRGALGNTHPRPNCAVPFEFSGWNNGPQSRTAIYGRRRDLTQDSPAAKCSHAQSSTAYGVTYTLCT